MFNVLLGKNADWGQNQQMWKFGCKIASDGEGAVITLLIFKQMFNLNSLFWCALMALCMKRFFANCQVNRCRLLSFISLLYITDVNMLLYNVYNDPSGESAHIFQVHSLLAVLVFRSKGQLWNIASVVCAYVKYTSSVSYQNKWDIRSSLGWFEMHAVWVNFSVDRFITLCSSGLSPSVPVPPVLPEVIFRVDWEMFAVLVC